MSNPAVEPASAAQTQSKSNYWFSSNPAGSLATLADSPHLQTFRPTILLNRRKIWSRLR